MTRHAPDIYTYILIAKIQIYIFNLQFIGKFSVMGLPNCNFTFYLFLQYDLDSFKVNIALLFINYTFKELVITKGYYPLNPKTVLSDLKLSEIIISFLIFFSMLKKSSSTKLV